MFYSSLLLAMVLGTLSSFALVARGPTHPANQPRSTVSDGLNCTSFNAPINASAMNLDLSFLGEKPVNQQAYVQSLIDQITVGSPFPEQLANASLVPVDGTYSIHFEYCYPTDVALQPSVLQLVHGLIGNAGYWNIPLEGSKGTNSFVKAAAKAGYATLAYDRLCVGGSDKADGTAVCQLPYEIAQAISISKGARDGSLGIGSWNSVVAVGHSYGSVLLFGLAASEPDTFDAEVLTGFTTNATSGSLSLPGFRRAIANEVNATKWADLPNDYVVTESFSGDQLGFLHYPNYNSKEVPQQYAETKSPYTIGQEVSLQAGRGGLPSRYTKPLLDVTGQNDGIFCTGDCYVTSLGPGKTQLDTVGIAFSAVPADDLATFILPANGHGINYHDNALDAYKVITDFLTGKGL